MTLRFGCSVLQMHDDGEDLVVGLAVGERGRQHRRDRFGLQEQACRSPHRSDLSVERDAVGDAPFGHAP